MKKGSVLTLDEIIQRQLKPYIAIIFLTLDFQKKLGGLELKHYRYALVQKDDQKQKIKDDLSVWFGENVFRLSFLRGSCIEKCITQRSNLVTYLKRLIELDILEIVPPIDKKNTKKLYRIKGGNDAFLKRLDKALLRWWFKRLGDESPSALLKKIQKKILQDFSKELENSRRTKKLKSGNHHPVVTR